MKKTIVLALAAIFGLSVMSFAAVTADREKLKSTSKTSGDFNLGDRDTDKAPNKDGVKTAKTPVASSRVAVKVKSKVHAIPVVKTTK